jgi:putative sterol carrier protein
MGIIFPTAEWVNALYEKLNSDADYARIAKKWEGDIVIEIEPSGPIKSEQFYYLDLWHGTCRKAAKLDELGSLKPAFYLKASYDNLVKIMKSELDPVQAMLTRKLNVQGNMAVMMRNVPVILDFVRCAREVTTEVLS